MDDDPLRAAIESDYVVERNSWASERVERVSARLQRDVAAADRLEPLVVWLDQHTAFTAPGRTIYFSRRLLERLADDDAAAFVVAHELAHHRLGHVLALPRSWLGVAHRLVISIEQRWIKTDERERDADLLAIELCVDAGYDPERCLAALEYLEQVSLDYGDVDGVLGSESGARRSHPSIRARVAAVRTHLAALQRGVRIPLDVSLQRERQRRRKVALVAASTAAMAVALVIVRRRP